MNNSANSFPKSCVVDTNVIVAANGVENCPQANLLTVKNAILALLALKNGGLVVDKGGQMISEYVANVNLQNTNYHGTAFVKWVMQTWCDDCFCERREISCTDTNNQIYAEFPSDPALATFDPSDRKFVAVANSKTKKLPILQAVDFKWWGWKDALAQVGIDVVFMDPAYAKAEYLKKHGGKKTKKK